MTPSDPIAMALSDHARQHNGRRGGELETASADGSVTAKINSSSPPEGRPDNGEEPSSLEPIMWLEDIPACNVRCFSTQLCPPRKFAVRTRPSVMCGVRTP